VMLPSPTADQLQSFFHFNLFVFLKRLAEGYAKRALPPPKGLRCGGSRGS
jgi:hypothetical protein